MKLSERCLRINLKREYPRDPFEVWQILAAFGEVDTCPMCIIMLRTPKVGPPSGDVGNLETLLLEYFHVVVGWSPYAQPVIRMVDEVHLSLI